MLQKAGADLWHLRNKTQSAGLWPSIKVPDYDTAFMRRTQFDAMSWIEVAKDHRRFNDESISYRLRHGKQQTHGTWLDGPHAYVLPVHMIFDDATRTAGPTVASLSARQGGSAISAVRGSVITWNVVVEKYSWSRDNGAEIEKGWIAKAETIAELAQRIGRDPGALEATVQRYNEACAGGHDDEFGRAAETLQPISGPPYYAVEIVPGTVSTTGGAKRNAQSGARSSRQTDSAPVRGRGTRLDDRESVSDRLVSHRMHRLRPHCRQHRGPGGTLVELARGYALSGTRTTLPRRSSPTLAACTRASRTACSG